MISSMITIFNAIYQTFSLSFYPYIQLYSLPILECLSRTNSRIHSLDFSHLILTLLNSILHIWKLKLIQVTWITQDHAASQQQSLDSDLHLTTSNVHVPSDPHTIILVKWIYQNERNWTLLLRQKAQTQRTLILLILNKIIGIIEL